jgi:hypothetical protein
MLLAYLALYCLARTGSINFGNNVLIEEARFYLLQSFDCLQLLIYYCLNPFDESAARSGFLHSNFVT